MIKIKPKILTLFYLSIIIPKKEKAIKKHTLKRLYNIYITTTSHKKNTIKPRKKRYLL